MRTEKEFTSQHRLYEWLDSKSWDFDNQEKFYQWLEEFFRQGNTIAVKGNYCDAQDCIDVFEKQP